MSAAARPGHWPASPARVLPSGCSWPPRARFAVVTAILLGATALVVGTAPAAAASAAPAATVNATNASTTSHPGATATTDTTRTTATIASVTPFTAAAAAAGDDRGASRQAKPVATAPEACRDAGCRIVTRRDVDGDGQRDATSLTPTQDSGAPAMTLRTVTATGEVSEILHRPFFPAEVPVDAWFGSAYFDGVPGIELIVRSGSGAHAELFRMYTWRSGKLVEAPAPGGQNEGQWLIDGGLNSVAGYTVSSSDGTRYLIETSLTRDDNEATFSGPRTTYRWSNDGWRRVSTSTHRIPATETAAAAVYGWHVAGLS